MQMDTTRRQEPVSDPDRTGWVAGGGILGALLASSCCIIPLVLFSIGVSGAWIGNLTALAPYTPLFLVVSAGFVGRGFWMVYRRPRACAAGDACARPLPKRVVKTALWLSLAMIVLAAFWGRIAPVAAPWLLGL